MRRKSEIDYKHCKISFTISPTENQFSAFARIFCITSNVTHKEIIRDRLFPTMEEAEKAIIQKARDWIDSNT